MTFSKYQEPCLQGFHLANFILLPLARPVRIKQIPFSPIPYQCVPSYPLIARWYHLLRRYDITIARVYQYIAITTAEGSRINCYCPPRSLCILYHHPARPRPMINNWCDVCQWQCQCLLLKIQSY